MASRKTPLPKSILDQHNGHIASPQAKIMESQPGRIPFVQSMRAWLKPHHFTPSPIPPEPGTPRQGVTEAVKKIASLWPTIGKAISNKQSQMNGLVLPVENTPPPIFKDKKILHFPWPARMNQASRNLFRDVEPIQIGWHTSSDDS
ncbi:hypothetical protein DY000_02021542 [Brassica cretica]|uniref:Uncharacterized protein n=1 Tax=Brassica cretica TaxID=69181 RepID=A0ABQ7E1S3_BRACR|nr:hypothetical protein DY000_02021542 [Brassica cretica]